jgi:RimJ/RimL family protein N-acetyltransferase
MPTRIREVGLDDVEPLQRFAARLFTENPVGVFKRTIPTLDEEREFIRTFTEPERSVLIAAEEDGEVIGLVSLLARQHPQEAHVGELGISVDAESRSRGIGTALIEALLEWAEAHGVTRVEVQAFGRNERAIALYERLGFVREGVRRGAVIVDGRRDDIVLLARLLD